MTITTDLIVVSTSLNSTMANGATTATETLVINIGPVPSAGLVAFASQTVSITNPTSDDLAAYAVGKHVTQTIAPAATASASTAEPSPSAS